MDRSRGVIEKANGWILFILDCFTLKRSRYGISTNLAGNTVKLFLDKESFKGFHDDARFLKASDETYWMLLPLRLSKEREGRSAIQLVSSFCMPFLILNRFL
jgi:hypothetical protein